jgi:hypothetical protein
MAEMLDIPVFMIEIPQQFLLAYYQTDFDFLNKIEKIHHNKIQFYIDPCNGTIFTQNDVDAYLKKYNFEINESYYKPLSAKEMLSATIDALRYTYEELEDYEKVEELQKLLGIFVA